MRTMAIPVLASINDVSADDWAALDTRGDPFASAAFLGTFENYSGGGTAHGHPALVWQPHHVALRDGTGAVSALAPMWLRRHSFGDFSRDWGWANAWHSAGLAYYPKLVTGIPYTPSPGPRLLVRSGDPSLRGALVEACIDATQDADAASWQCLFVDDNDRAALAAAGCLLRRGVQFHWRNRDFASFDDFLATFTAEKRKKLKRERRAVAESGLLIETLHGDEIAADAWPALHAQYRDTFERYGNHPALPVGFFIDVARALGRRMVVFTAREPVGTLVASAICYRDDNTLYGRHWGAARQVPGLHFELCYYQGIAYCIRERLARFEPGAQGEHKLARGFEPTDTWSAFWIADTRMRAALTDYLRREDAAMRDYADQTAAHLPFKAPFRDAAADA